MAGKKTIQEIMDSSAEFLTPTEVSGVLGCDAHTLSLTARQRPELVNFPFAFSGSRMKIPRIPFLRFMGVII